MQREDPWQESEADLYEDAPCGYLSALPDGLVVKANRTFLSWVGVERDALIGKARFQSLLSVPGRVFFESHFRPILLAEGRVDEVAFDLKLPAGRALPVLVTGVLGRDADGAPAVVRLTVFNATERRAYEQALLRKTRELDLLNERKNELIGMVAHDLRTPLGAISAYSNLLASELGPTLSPAHRELLDTILDLSAFMSALVTDILDVSSIESGRPRLDRRPRPVAPVLRRAAQIHAVLARKKGIAIEVRAEEQGVFCAIDARKIDQVLNNLVGNAIKFSPRGGRVELSLSAGPDEVAIAVADQGPGIAPGEIERIFAPFATGSARGTAGETSTGLGLAIAQSIVAGHGGQIRVTSTPGAGATFTFTLPRCAPPPDEERPPESSVGAPLRPLRVLLAEDNTVNQKLVTRMLARLGAEVAVAGTGRDAVARLEREAFDLVLMDCRMPDMDGYEAAAAVRAREGASGRARVPILALTAGAEDDRARCLAAGMDDFLQKPTSLDQLSAALRRWSSPAGDG